ncbi:Integrase, catalytic core [Corchorus capsularis]|uniref:Integrase, catalytic core n=1 Tax=Corchorus capsularis TaxID=210143 RepID=A0A1R3G2J6_COCAP|nr:Integrase, catalytic core [Corchorus capsularis]
MSPTVFKTSSLLKSMLLISDGTALKIYHTGSTKITPSTHPLSLNDVLCVPQSKSNLLSVSKLTESNDVSVEFFSKNFLVKELHTKEPVAHGLNRGILYYFTNNNPPIIELKALAMLSTKTDLETWHHRLGHHTSSTLHSVLNSFSLPCSSNKHFSSSNVCSCNTSHRLPFSTSSVTGRGPLDVIYTDVWGPARITSDQGFKYYVAFVDLFTRYTWFYPMKFKYDVYLLFPKFKSLVENYFKTKIVTIFSDCGASPTTSTSATENATTMMPLINAELPQIPQAETLQQTESPQATNTGDLTLVCAGSSQTITETIPQLETVEPTSSTTAIKDPQWKQTMLEELEALNRNGTWDLVPAPTNCTIVGCKWVFRIKRNVDGSIARYKARLVAKRLVLCLAFTNGWPLQQLDVNNAFLQGDLQDEIYMKQPPVLYDKQHPTLVCKLKKAIYSLKQAPRAWYCALSNFLISFDFKKFVADTSLFIYKSGDIVAYMLVYVDDLILTGNNKEFLATFTQTLASKFSIKDLGSLHYFLGIAVTNTASGLFLSQSKYIADLLEKASMTGAKECSTPLSTSNALTLNDGTASVDDTEFRKLIGSLQYLTLTKPDICYAKRNQAYTDSDWAGNRDDRKSTSAYILYLGNNLISWCSKKQKIVARSSTEAEYRAIASSVSELTWIESLLHELHATLPEAPLVLCDNLSATYTYVNPVFHTRMKSLCFYPKGNNKSGGDDHISLYLKIAETSTLPYGWEVLAEFEFFIFDQLRDTYLTIQEAEVRRFQKTKTEWGITRLLSLDIFKDISYGYLLDDCCVFGVEVVVIKHIGRIECFKLIKPLNNSFTREIKKFSTLRKEDY